MRVSFLRPLLVLVTGAGVSFALARQRSVDPVRGSWAADEYVHVPHLRGSITLDGDADDSGWRGATLRTGGWVGPDGVTAAHPYSEARMVWGDGFLYLNLYAADEDIRGASPDGVADEDDFFHLVFKDATTERAIDVNPLGALRSGSRARGGTGAFGGPWRSGAHVSHELDGTPNRPSDNDEEWVLELAIPFESMGLEGEPGERVELSMSRCDTPHRGARVCGSWGEAKPRVLVLDDVQGSASASARALGPAAPVEAHVGGAVRARPTVAAP